MPSKIIWLAMLFTLVYWLGSAGGCASKGDNQNYEILNDDRPMFDTRHDTDKPGASLPPETEPSVNGVDRSHWATIQTQPDDGSTPYQPHYFTDLPLDATPPRDSPLDGGDMVAWDPINTQAAFAQPIKVAVDLATLPIKLVQDPPRFGQLRIASGWDGSDEAVAADSSDATPPDETVPADAGS